MTNVNISSNDAATISEFDLVQPDRSASSIGRASNGSSRLPLPLPDIIDTGRISFGASCRILRSGM